MWIEGFLPLVLDTPYISTTDMAFNSIPAFNIESGLYLLNAGSSLQNSWQSEIYILPVILGY